MKIYNKIIKIFQLLIDLKSKSCIPHLLLFLFIIVIFHFHSSAFGNIHFGSFEFHPFLNVSSGYADNIYLTPEGNEESSSYTSYSPGLSCDWKKNNHRIQLSYLYEFLDYNNHRAGIYDKDLFDLNSKLDFRFGKSGNAIDLYGGYRYRKTYDPLTSEQRAYNRKEMSTKFATGFNFTDRFGLRLNSNLIQNRFTDKEPAMKWDKDVIIFSSKAGIMPFAKTGILLEYGLIISEYQDSNKPSYYDSKTHSILTGIELETSSKLSGAIKAGYQWRYYNDMNDNSYNSPETWRVEVDLKHKFSELTSLQLRLERSIEDSDFKYTGQEAGFYYSNQVQFTVNHKPNYKLETWLDIFYNYSDYKKVSREDEVWQFDLGLSYQFKDWIGANLKYRSRRRDTKIESIGSFLYDESGLDYKSNQFSIGLNLIF